jgi:hypothetical protein
MSHAGGSPTEITLELGFWFPEVPASQTHDAWPAVNVTFFMEVRDVIVDGHMKIEVEGMGQEGQHIFMYGGQTYQEAYDSVH